MGGWGRVGGDVGIRITMSIRRGRTKCWTRCETKCHGGEIRITIRIMRWRGFIYPWGVNNP
jgi:hypothetical protein